MSLSRSNQCCLPRNAWAHADFILTGKTTYSDERLRLPYDSPPTQSEDSASGIAWYANLSAPSDLGLRNSVEPALVSNWRYCYKRWINEQALALELLELVLVQTPGEVLALEQALTENDLGTLGRIIHSQKASFEVFGLLEVVRLARAVEQQQATPKAARRKFPS